MDDFSVFCTICEKTKVFHGPIERVNFILKTLTSCPCGSPHETLPTASTHAYILKEKE